MPSLGVNPFEFLNEHFANKNEKLGEFCAVLDVQEPKSFQLQGGFAPLTPHQGLCPWTPLWAPPPDPCYRLTLRVLAMVRPPFRKSWIRPCIVSSNGISLDKQLQPCHFYCRCNFCVFLLFTQTDSNKFFSASCDFLDGLPQRFSQLAAG